MSDPTTTFIERCVRGEPLVDEIDDFVDQWHKGGSGVPLHEFLGMSYAEYSRWVADPDALPLIITEHAQKSHLPR